MSALALKLFACTAMFCDHLGYLTANEALRILGRTAMPIYAFFIAAGYKKSSDPFRYLLRLMIFGVLSEGLFDYCFFGRLRFEDDQNVMFTLALGLLAVIIYDKLNTSTLYSLLALIPVGLCCCTAELLCLDYGLWGVLLIFVYYIICGSDTSAALKTVGITLTTVLFAARFVLVFAFSQVLISVSDNVAFLSFLRPSRPSSLSSWQVTQIYASFAAIPILFYNGKRGIEITSPFWKKVYQYSFYAFYPIHLLVLIVIFG